MKPTGYYGSPVHGYDIRQLMDNISEIIDAPQMQNVALVGLGHLGRAVLDYFQGRRPKLQIIAAFDTDPGKINLAIHGCRCLCQESKYDCGSGNRLCEQNGLSVNRSECSGKWTGGELNFLNRLALEYSNYLFLVLNKFFRRT